MLFRLIVGVFFSAKEEEVESDGSNNTSLTKQFFWLEFVDRDIQPDYYAQRGIDVQKFPSEGISSEEMVELAIAGTVAVAQIGIQIALLAA